MNKGMKNLTSRERKLYLLLGSLIFAAVAAGITYIKPMSDINYMVSDLFYESLVRENNEDSNIKIISIDEKTKKELGDYSTWSRSELATFIEKLDGGSNAPDVIGIDLELYDAKDSKGDAALVDACGKYDNICIAGTVSTGGDMVPSGTGNPPSASPPSGNALPDAVNGEKITGINLPFPDLLQEVSTGIVNANSSGPDGNVRSSFTGLEYQGAEYDSFSIAIYKLHLANQGKKYTPPKIDKENAFGFNFAMEKSDYEEYSFADVRSGDVSTSVFKDAIVLLANEGVQNTYQIPGQHHEQVQEINLQANFIDALLQNQTILYVAKWFMAIWYAVFAALFFIATSFESKIRTLVDSLMLIVIQVVVSGLVNYAGYYIPMLQLILIVILIAVYNLFASYLISRWQRKNLERTFKMYVDGQIVDEIVNNGPVAASIGVVRKDISVLFVDIRGFTSLSESLPPEHIVDILNHYLTIIADAVARNGGTLDKFIGDAAMAVFNSPIDLDDYVYKSVCTAWDILSNAVWLNELCQKKYGREVAFGIGIHCGDAVVGNIGSQSRMDYTAIGDTVNTSSRLESSACKGQILISDEVKNRLGERIYTNYSGNYTLKGKAMAIDAYELTGIRDYTSVVKKPKDARRMWKLPSMDELPKLPKTLEELPKTLESLPKTLEELPKTLESLPKTLEELPKTLEDLPKTLKDLPIRSDKKGGKG